LNAPGAGIPALFWVKSHLSSVRGQPADHPNKLPHTVHHFRGEPHTDKKENKIFFSFIRK
jgi:hypothetical protein